MDSPARLVHDGGQLRFCAQTGDAGETARSLFPAIGNPRRDNFQGLELTKQMKKKNEQP
jgi:hypothetical protein